jgi:hypothetical protein
MNRNKKYELIDWDKYQILYNNGLTWQGLVLCGLSNNAISWARKNEKLKMNTSTETRRKNHILGKYDYAAYKTSEHRALMRKFGGLKEKSGRCKHILFIKNNGDKIILQGSWEEKIAMFFEQYDIKWIKNKAPFPYIFNNKSCLYYPDFYLEEYNIYIEVKGYVTDRDVSKWNFFPHILIKVKKEELLDLNYWWRSLNINNNILQKTPNICNHNADKKIKYIKSLHPIKKQDYFKRRVVERPTKEVLSELIKKIPLTKVGLKYGVSDNSIRKWCKFYNIDTPKNGRGYWSNKTI